MNDALNMPCANADICDYWIVGDGSEEAKAHPRKTDDKGY